MPTSRRSPGRAGQRRICRPGSPKLTVLQHGQGDIEPTTEVNCAPDGRARPSWQECIAEVESEAEEGEHQTG
jgi:hypothetical protein